MMNKRTQIYIILLLVNIFLSINKSQENAINKELSLKKTLVGHTKEVFALTSLPNGELASGSFNEIKFWNTNEGTVKLTLANAHRGWIRSLVVLPNGDLASAGDDRTIKIWEIGSNEVFLKKTIEGHTSGVTCLLALPNGDLAVWFKR